MRLSRYQLVEMACQELADIDSDDDDMDTTVKSRSGSKSKKHKQALFNLSEDDPEFYKFLLEYDKELLQFSEGDSDSEEVSSDSGSEEGKLESVSDTHSESDSDKSIESNVVDEKVTTGGEDIEEDAKRIVTKEQVE